MMYVPTILAGIIYVGGAIFTLLLLWRLVKAVERIADNLEKKN